MEERWIHDHVTWTRKLYRDFFARRVPRRQLLGLAVSVCVGPGGRAFNDHYESPGPVFTVPAGAVLVDVCDREGPVVTLRYDATGARFVACLPTDRDLVESVRVVNHDEDARATLTRHVRTFLRRHELLPTSQRRTA